MRKVHFSVKKIILCIVAVLSFLLFLVLSAVIRHLAGAQEAQQMAARWSEKKNVAQISCFFSPTAYVTEDSIKEFEQIISPLRFWKSMVIPVDYQQAVII